MKTNYIKNFEGVKLLINRFERLMKKCDITLYNHLIGNDIQLFHFGFRWFFCLLLREFPLMLSIKLLDYYLVEDTEPSELCLYLSLGLILRFSVKIKSL